MNKSNSYIVQAVLFDNEIYTTNQARQWLKSHNYEPLKRVHKTDKYLRYRIQIPQAKSKYVVKSLNNGDIKLILMK